MERLTILLVLVCAYQVRGEAVSFRECSNYPNKNCSISEVRIEPCPEAAKNEACKIQRGKSATIEFDYTPIPNVSGLESKVYWATGTMDLPWVGFDTDGCSKTTCPTTDQKQTYRYQLTIGKKYPVRKYEIKWRLFKEEEMECCFTTFIQLTK